MTTIIAISILAMSFVAFALMVLIVTKLYIPSIPTNPETRSPKRALGLSVLAIGMLMVFFSIGILVGLSFDGIDDTSHTECQLQKEEEPYSPEDSGLVRLENLQQNYIDLKFNN